MPAEAEFKTTQPKTTKRSKSKKVPKVPTVRSGKATIKGTMDKDIIGRIVTAHINEVRYCYNQGLARDSRIKGRVSIQFNIGPTGSVPVAVVAESTVSDSNVSNCIAKAVKRWTFPKPPGGGSAMVTYPFLLDRANKATRASTSSRWRNPWIRCLAPSVANRGLNFGAQAA